MHTHTHMHMHIQVRIAPGHPKLLGTDPVTGHPLHHYQIAIDRGLSYEEACRMLRDKAAHNGGQLFRHEGFMRRRQPWCGSHVVVLLLQQPTPAWCMDSRPIFKVWTSPSPSPKPNPNSGPNPDPDPDPDPDR
jgi:hypothetical protein